jgi:hypothetical protein
MQEIKRLLFGIGTAGVAVVIASYWRRRSPTSSHGLLTLSDRGRSVEPTEVAALAALYQADRADQAQQGSGALTLIAGSVAYLGLLVTAWKDIAAAPYWPVLLPGPLWMVAAFHVLTMGNVLNRNHSIRVLEVRLHSATRLRALGVAANEIGSARGREVMDLNLQPALLKVQTLVTYVGIAGVLLLTTFYGIWDVQHHHGWDWQVWTAAIVYGILALVLAGAWLNVVWLLDERGLPAWARWEAGEHSQPGQLFE